MEQELIHKVNKITIANLEETAKIQDREPLYKIVELSLISAIIVFLVKMSLV